MAAARALFFSCGVCALLAMCGCGAEHPTAPSQRLFVVIGTVKDIDSGVPIANVRLELRGGARSGQVFTADQNGQFFLPPLPAGDFEILFSKTDYDDLMYSVKDLASDRALDVAMTPKRISMRWEGWLEAPSGHNPCLEIFMGWPGPYFFTLQRAGEVTLTLDADAVVGGTASDFGFSVWSRNCFGHLSCASVLSVWSYHPAAAGGLLKYRWVRTTTLEPGEYVLHGGVSGICQVPRTSWIFTLTRPR